MNFNSNYVIILLAIWHIALSSWNHISSKSLSINCSYKKSFIIERYRLPFKRNAWLSSFFKNIRPNHASRPYAVPNSDMLFLVNVPILVEIGFVAENDFLAKTVLFSSTQSTKAACSLLVLHPVSTESYTSVGTNLFLKFDMWWSNSCEWREINIFRSSVNAHRHEGALTGIFTSFTDPAFSNLCTKLWFSFFFWAIMRTEKMTNFTKCDFYSISVISFNDMNTLFHD